MPPKAGFEVFPHLISVPPGLFLVPIVLENFKNKPFIRAENAIAAMKNIMYCIW